LCAILGAFISTRRVSRSILVILETKTPRKNDYKSMRIIEDKLYAELVRILSDDPKVKVFQQLILAPTAEPTAQPDEIKTENEVKEK
jgi:hypothetical protein